MFGSDDPAQYRVSTNYEDFQAQTSNGNQCGGHHTDS